MRRISRWWLLGLAVLGSVGPAPAQFKEAPVVVAPLVTREVAPRQLFVGTILPKRTSVIGSAASGRVEQFLVDEGDRVRKGQELAVLRTKIIQAEVNHARGELKARQAELEELTNGSRPEEKEQAQARLATTEALMELRKAVLRRVRTGGAAYSAQELDEAMALADQASGQFQDAKATLKLVQEGPRKEKIDQARAKVEAAQAELDRLEEQLERHTMRAPFDGYVTAEHSEVGQWVLQGASLVEIAELDEVDVEVPLLEDYVSYVRLGQKVKVEVSALPGEPYEGTVVAIVPRANLKARTFPVKVRVKNPQEKVQVKGTDGKSVERLVPRLKAGMLARVELPTAAVQIASLVPRDALVLSVGTRKVFVMDPDPADAKKGKVRPVDVELGVAVGDLIQVRGKLAPDAIVVVQGNERLQPGQAVSVLRVQKTETPAGP